MTLIELLVAIALVALITAIGIPSYQSITTSSRMASELNSLVGDLQYARAEAVKRGQNVTVCPSTNGTACATTSAWQGGWIVFPDPNNNQTVDTGETVLRYQTAFSSADTLVGKNNLQFITFNGTGFSLPASGSADRQITLNDAANDTSRRSCVIINSAGHLDVENAGSGNCS